MDLTEEQREVIEQAICLFARGWQAKQIEVLRSLLAAHNAGAQGEPVALLVHHKGGVLHLEPWTANRQWCLQNERCDIASLTALTRCALPDLSDYLDSFGNPRANCRRVATHPQPMTDAARDVLCPNGEPWNPNPDGINLGDEQGPRVNPETGHWEGVSDED